MIAAAIPAAGLSTRMGRPKLLLEIDGKPVIERIVSAMLEGGASRVVVAVGPAFQDGADRIGHIASASGAEVVRLAAPTAEMRATVEAIFRHLEMPRPPDCVLLAPADSVGIGADLVSKMISAIGEYPGRIIVPTDSGRRGHPLALPWEAAREVFTLPPGVGVKAILERLPDRVLAHPVASPGLAEDLDTPEDYRRWSAGE